MSKAWHTLTQEEVLKVLDTQVEGLTKEEAKNRLSKYGPNSLPEEKVNSFAKIFLRQFQSSLIYVLLGAASLIFIIGERVDAYIILAVLIFNAIVGALQEGKAENTLLALKKFTETNATVVRGGNDFIIPDTEVVVGDILILQEGEKISADARVIQSENIKVNEASLTGESEPVYKVEELISNEKADPSDQRNMLFKVTNIVSGNGKAVVVATGVATLIGSIAIEISGIESEIPLRKNIRNLSRAIMWTVALISVFLFVSGVIVGYSMIEMFMVVVSLAVSVIPEGLPIVITLVLAAGVWRMSKKNALVKKLQAVEALGQARVIAVDKTGTITKNELVVRKVWVDGKTFEVGGVGYDPLGEIKLNGNIVDAANHPELLNIGKLSILCGSARLSFSEEENIWKVSGDPTEAAMIVLGEKVGFHKDETSREMPLLSESPFDYKLRYHRTVHKDDETNIEVVVGAPESVLLLCKHYISNGERHALTDEKLLEFQEIFMNMSEEGMRVLGVASKSGVREPYDLSKQPLDFVGFLGMKDALRQEVKEAMSLAKEAGIRVVMITGDYQITARSIAKDALIYNEGDLIMTGEEVSSLSEIDLSEKIKNVSVFARVSPEHKFKIVNAYKRRGEVIAMTGDGVNDAPSLVAADLGVSMGKIGTEVAKEASDIVLLDDNFGSIIYAVEEGRNIYKTIRKVVLYLFSTSVGEVMVISAAIFLGFPLPLLAVQIIWLNLVTDGFLTVALGMEPKEKGLLHGTFKKPSKYIVDYPMVRRMLWMAIPMTVGSLYLFSQYLGGDMVRAWTISLTTLSVFQWFNAWNCRSDTRSVFQMNPFSNLYLVGATFIVVSLHFFAVYNPFLQSVLHTTSLSLADWLIILPVSASIIVVEEIRKLISKIVIIHGSNLIKMNTLMKKNIASVALIILLTASALPTMAHGRSESATSTAENLMHVANRNGGLGEEIRKIAREHASSTDVLKMAKKNVEETRGVMSFLFGTDYKNIGVIRSEVAKIDARIEALRREGEKLIEWDENLLEDEIHLMEEEKAELLGFVEEHEDAFSLFGWFVRMFN
ncbi:MAG: cation-translocating P-type ATPase [Minisyncoccota bacterium]